MDSISTPPVQRQSGCPFCASVTREAAFMDSQDFIALYNISPVLPGHSLVIPKTHRETIGELTDAELSEFTLFARKVTEVLTEVFSGTGTNWSLQENASAGQTVRHLHMHILVRKDGDLPVPGDWYPAIRKNEDSMLDSFSRSQLDQADYRMITERLKTFAAGSRE